ncbi:MULTISPECIES: DUF982 domain-containing protein [Aminobacter]|jgi:hypothetical protein|uniref:DUF982 domain-containing protein n=1 Tax=Aminobacter ciceronei TaxID=150723 RepID=A0ABR6CD09_9HYPH|nr:MULTISPECIES: DUF982 domain-containing protein [Aminobacter]MBA8909134.1 hypothetical protein [Aminobacter ciceronei]MBA9022906.1 hypothetical protein [Aminobacter ciceronei]QOF70828.1 DUF982 domain-containing protein [Aminobacter sp. SR38]
MDFDIIWIAFEGRTIAISSIDEARIFLSEWPGGLRTETARLAVIALTRAETAEISTTEVRQVFLDFCIDAQILASID